MGAVGRSSGAIQHYLYGFGTVQLAIDRDGGSWSRMGFQAGEPREVEFSSWIFGDFMERQSMELST